MSIQNVWNHNDRVIVAVDTDAIDGDGGHNEITKILSLPHASTVMAIRGDRRFLWDAFSRCFLGGATVDYDMIARDVEQLVASVVLGARAELGGRTLPPAVSSFQLLTAGWSASQERMRAHLVTGDLARDTFDIEEVGSPGESESRLSPWEFPEAAPKVLTEEDALALARRQAAWLRMQGAAGGGRLLIAEVTRKQTRIFDAGSLA